MTATTVNSSVTPLVAEGISAYLSGPPPESRQFDFFIGRWSCAVTISGAEATGTELTGEWVAKSVHEGRAIVDELTIFLPTGERADAWLSLRTFSSETNRWEIAGIRALSPIRSAVTVGTWTGKEMHLSFQTEGPGGKHDNAIRFYNVTEQAFDWEWKIDLAGEGASDWSRFAHIHASRVA